MEADSPINFLVSPSHLSHLAPTSTRSSKMSLWYCRTCSQNFLVTCSWSTPPEQHPVCDLAREDEERRERRGDRKGIWGVAEGREGWLISVGYSFIWIPIGRDKRVQLLLVRYADADAILQAVSTSWGLSVLVTWHSLPILIRTPV